MGVTVANLDRIRRETGAHLMVLHHLNKSGGTRGSTAINGALDTQIMLKRNGDLVRITCEKQKEADNFAPMNLTKHIVPLANGSTSLVFHETDRAVAGGLRDREQKALTVLQGLAAEEGTKRSDWARACASAGIAPTSFGRAKDTLMEMNLVRQIGAGRGVRFEAVLTDAG